MERGDCCKDIGVLAVDGLEDFSTDQLVETEKTGHIATHGEIGDEAIVHDIPGRSSRMDVIPGKAYEVDKKECGSKAAGRSATACKVEVEAI